MAMDLPSGAIWGSVRRTIRPMLSMPKRAEKRVADRHRNRGASFLRSIANLLEGITIMASTGKGKRTPLWWNDGPEMKQPLGTRQAAQRGAGFRTDGDGESPRHRPVQTHCRRDHPSGWAEPEPGACPRRPGMVVSAVRAPGDGAAGFGAGGACGQAGAVGRPEAGAALGAEEGGSRSLEPVTSLEELACFFVTRDYVSR